MLEIAATAAPRYATAGVRVLKLSRLHILNEKDFKAFREFYENMFRDGIYGFGSPVLGKLEEIMNLFWSSSSVCNSLRDALGSLFSHPATCAR